MNNILIISGDMVGSNMGGVGVRYWELAHALAKHCQVTLAVPDDTDLTSEQINLHPYKLKGGDLSTAAQSADAIILHGFVLHFHPYLPESGKPLAVDLYVPYLLESLVWHASGDWQAWIPAYEEYLRVQLELLRAGDFFFCASERQRDYWLGWLHAQKRINPHTYRQDPTLRSLIDVVPFGLPDEEPKTTQPVLRGAHPAIQQEDKIILWSGGLWDWLDPFTPIRALARLAPTHPEIKLYFMGTRHPNPAVRGMSIPEKAIALSRELGLLDKQVFFGDWVPYSQRVNYLLEADLGVVSYPGHIETRFSFRTRVLDCIWTSLPLVTTQGDSMADWVERHQLGVTVPPGDVEAMAAAFEEILTAGGRTAFAPAFSPLQGRLRWSSVVRPLLDFCLHPAPAPDKGHYLTEAERIARDKDAFLAQVVQEKDEFTQQVARDKDAFWEGIVAERNQVIAELQQTLARYQRLLPFRMYRWLKRTFS